MLRSFVSAVGIASVLLWLLAGCGGSERIIVETPPSGSSDYSLTISPLAADAAVAQSLGWGSAIPGAEVTLMLADSSAPRTFTTNALGTVSIPALTAGKYIISARRIFSTAEVAKLGPASDALAFVGEVTVALSPTDRASTVAIPASFRRSLVISEWSFNLKYAPGTLGSYESGGFLELYNNGDTTVYLDGILIGNALSQTRDFPSFSCALLEPFRNDPAGIWTRDLAAFPGTGRQFPLAPGSHIVVATDAIDHRQFSPDLLDLRSAHFEFIGAADVDNPAVPNMIDHSLSDPFGGHGLNFRSPNGIVAAVAGGVDPGTLTMSKLPPNAKDYVRLPRERMLDVFATSGTYDLNDPAASLCPQQVNTALDRKEGFFLQNERNEFLFSLHRKTLLRLPNGRVVLQHTRTSVNDYRRRLRTPGVVQ